MKWTVLFLLLSIGVQNHAHAEFPWTLFAKNSYFSEENRSCKNKILETLGPVLRSRGVSDTEIQNIVNREVRSRDVLHPMITGSNILIGTNLRWRNVSTECRNNLLHCDGNQENSCKEITSFPNEQVLTPIFLNDSNIIAKRTTYPPEVLNIGRDDYLVSSDFGKTWKKIETPIQCDARQSEVECTLIPQTKNTYILLSSNLNKQVSEFQNFTIHSTDNGGESWRELTPPWSEIKDHFHVSAADGNLQAIAEGDAEYFSISLRNIGTGNNISIETKIPNSEWNSKYSMVFSYRDKYLVKAQKKWETNEPQEIGVFFVDKLLPHRSAKPVWTSLGMDVSDVKIFDDLVVVRTWNSKSLSSNKRNFNESIHYTVDEGINWSVLDVPDDLLGSTMEISKNRIWMFSPFSVQYIDLAIPKSE